MSIPSPTLFSRPKKRGSMSTPTPVLKPEKRTPTPASGSENGKFMTMKMNSMPSIDSDEKDLMHFKSNKEEIMTGFDTKKLLQNLLNRYL